jgi:hypothetical protein
MRDDQMMRRRLSPGRLCPSSGHRDQ